MDIFSTVDVLFDEYIFILKFAFKFTFLLAPAILCILWIKEIVHYYDDSNKEDK